MKEVRIIGFPISLGSPKIGTELAPNALRYAGLVKKAEMLDLHIEDLGNIEVDNAREINSPGNAKNLRSILKFDRMLAEKVTNSLLKGKFPLILGGDHSMAVGSLAGLSTYSKSKCGVIYFDAHADFNTPSTTKTGNVHGMPLALACGKYTSLKDQLLEKQSLDPKKTVIIGVRSLDREEEKLVDDAGVIMFTPDQIEKDGIYEVTEKAIKIASKGNAAVHVSLDLDVIDPSFVCGVGTPVIGGLMTREVKLSVAEIYKSGVMKSFELAELNPSLDKNNVTVDTALELILIALGKKSHESLL